MERLEVNLLEEELYLNEAEEVVDEDDEEPEEDSEDEPEEPLFRYDDETEEEGRYDTSFSLNLSGVYIDKDGKTKIEYNILYEELDPANEKDTTEPPTHFDDLIDVPESQPVDYKKDILPVMHDIDYPAEIIDDVINISYDKPEFINGQKTYQRIVFEADMEGESVYDLTIRKLKDAGMDTKTEYDNEFDSMIFTSINGKKEGHEDNFNEFYLNGDIGANAADLEKVKKGDVIEWRYAEETDGSCGGVPDFNQIKSMVQYSAGAKAYADSLLLN